MLCVRIYEFTNVLTFVGALLDDGAVVLEQMVDEELVELFSWTLSVLIDLSGQGLAEEESVGETALDWRELLKQHEEVSVEDSYFIGALVECLNY